jgi:O-antigen/teichoic acid export membrane protein
MDEVQEGYASRRQTRRKRIEERQADRQLGGLGWLAGLVLIGIGVYYLLYEFGYVPVLTNWWALFLLLPAIGTLSAALGAYRRNGGQWTMEVTLPLIGGLLFLGLTAVFLFDLNYSWVWSLFLIAAGLLIVASSLLVKNKSA